MSNDSLVARIGRAEQLIRNQDRRAFSALEDLIEDDMPGAEHLGRVQALVVEGRYNRALDLFLELTDE